MKRPLFRKAVCLVLSVTLLMGALGFTTSAAKYKPDDTSSSLDEMKSLVNAESYASYIAENGKLLRPGMTRIPVDIMTFTGNAQKASESAARTSYDKDKSKWENFGENWENTLYLPATGSVTWHFNIPDGADSLYYISIEYFSCVTDESSISTIERKFRIDDTVPFSEASYISLSKTWRYAAHSTETSEAPGVADGYDVSYETREDGYFKIVTLVKDGKRTVTTYRIEQDINGNSMAPQSEQVADWQSYYVQDTTGYYHGYFQFYLLNGSHTLTLAAQREPVMIKSITLVPADSEEDTLDSYANVRKNYEANGYTPATGGKITTIQAEFPDMVSDSSVNASNDNTSAATFPVASKAQLYNVIGETSYSTVGQWAAYKFSVDKTGLYKLAMRYKQDALQGMYICRTLKLAGGNYGLPDGTATVPFAEAYNCQFNYSKEWQSTVMADGDGNEFEFYFEEGVEYTLVLECSLGTLKELIQRVENSLNVVNDCYLKILQLTGSEPDEYRDYKFDEIMPDVLYNLLVQAKELVAVKEEFVKLCKTDGSHIATLKTVAVLLDIMGSDYGDNIARNLSTMKSYLGTLGTWVNSSKRSSMMVDSISVIPADSDDSAIPKANAGFFRSLWFEIQSFFYSFIVDYDNMGLTTVPDPDTPNINVWLATGRDQSQIWRTMIDAQGGFTESTGVAVTLKLVTGGTLLPSILSGKGPDVYMGLGSADVINYAIRDAVVGISGNDPLLSDEDNAVFNTTYYTYKGENGDYENTAEYRGEEGLKFVSNHFNEAVNGNYVKAAMDTVQLLGVTYGIPQEMGFSMMFYRMDILANLGVEVPETWDELLALLPVLQSNNMNIGINYTLALEFMIYQAGGNMWKYPDNPQYAGSKIDLDSDIAIASFERVCSWYTDYSFPVTYDAANRFRTGEMPIVVGDYSSLYNQLTVYATEIQGMWEFSSLPGTVREDGTYNYSSIAGITASVMLHGCENTLAAWQYMQWQTSAEVEADYGNKMVALIGPSAKYNAANINAIKNLSWTASERAAIEDQITHMASIVNYPGSYIIGRYMKFAFLAVVNDSAVPADSMNGYIDAINAEITRKRSEFNLPTLKSDEEPPKTQGENN